MKNYTANQEFVFGELSLFYKDDFSLIKKDEVIGDFEDFNGMLVKGIEIAMSMPDYVKDYFTLTSTVPDPPFGLQGNQGPQGASSGGGGGGTQGPQGPQGTQGNIGTGTQGFQGDNGNDGNQGPQGDTGLQGNDGIGNQGPQGTRGLQGLNGIDGNQGPQGLQGTGNNGSQGPQGTAGLQGNNGTGTQGPQGNTGVGSTIVDPPASDLTVSGEYLTETVGENVTIFQALYLKASDSKWYKADNTTATKAPALRLATASISSSAAGVLLRSGMARNDAWTWTVGGAIYLGAAGALTQTAPTTEDYVIQKLGTALSATVIDFNPSIDVATYTANGTSPAPWIALSNFSTTAASTSTITMTADLTSTLSAGLPIKFKLSGTYYYAQITAITSNLMTIRGAPLTTGSGALTELYYGLASQLNQIHVLIPGLFEAATSTTLLLTFAKDQLKWKEGNAYCVGFDYIVGTADGGGTQPNINVRWGGNRISTANTNAGPLVSASWQSTAIDINTTNYGITFGTALEIECTKGTTGDAANLSLEILMVHA